MTIDTTRGRRGMRDDVMPFQRSMLTVFTSTLCGMCAVLRHWLDDLRVAYREVNIDAVPEARRVLRGVARGDLIVPTVIMEDGGVLLAPDRARLLRALHTPRRREDDP